MPTLPTNTISNQELIPIWPEDAREITVALMDGTYARGTVLGASTAVAASEVQTLSITGTPTGGTFRLNFTNPWTGTTETTSALAYNATAAQVQAALLALDSFEAGDVTCAGGALPGTAVTITFGGRYATRNIAALTTTDSLTGGSTPSSAIATTTAGVVPVGTFGTYATSNSDGTGVAVAILKRACRVVLGKVYLHGSHDEGLDSAPAFYCGDFKTDDLTGLDSDALTDLKARLIVGSVSSGIVHIP